MTCRTKIPVGRTVRRYRLWSFIVSSLLLSRAAASVVLRLFGLSSPNFLRVDAFHDCVQSRKRARNRGSHRRFQRFRQEKKEPISDAVASALPLSCEGGICVGMTNGPHQGGNASYPLAWNGTAGTRLESTMTVPEYPSGLETEDDFSQITYYIWTDIFFGDESFGRMNQLVPQLILGSALDGSSGPPNFDPEWNTIHKKWTFGAHYFFEVWNPATNTTDAHAAYGDLFPAVPGETLLTTFELSSPSRRTAEEEDSSSSSFVSSSPAWTLTMSVLGDPQRTSILTVSEPYMGLGKQWSPKPSTSWLEPNFQNLCINACWELYGASDASKLPASGAECQLKIEQPLLPSTIGSQTPSVGAANSTTAAQSNTRTNNVRYPKNDNWNPSDKKTPSSDDWKKDRYYDFTTWERDEGNGVCPSIKVSEIHTQRTQEVFVEIDVACSVGLVTKTETTTAKS